MLDKTTGIAELAEKKAFLRTKEKRTLDLNH